MKTINMTHQMKAKESPTNGILIIDKKTGMTSMDVLRRVKQATGQKKGVGHGGTLDPLAEGVLPICFGQATRLMELLVSQTKEYTMTIRLGVTTDTYDSEGVASEEAKYSHLSRETIENTLEKFRGTFPQTPPMYSALKREGKRLYQLAREGIEVEREPRLVDVHDINIVGFALPFLTIQTECGRGLYMRSLAHDFGQELGCGAHVSYLKRTRTGLLSIDGAMSLEEFEKEVYTGNWRNFLQSIDSLLLSYNSTIASERTAQLLRNGQAVSLPIQEQGISHLDTYRIYTDGGQFLGLIRYDKPVDRWLPFKIFNLREPSPHFDQ